LRRSVRRSLSPSPWSSGSSRFRHGIPQTYGPCWSRRSRSPSSSWSGTGKTSGVWHPARKAASAARWAGPDTRPRRQREQKAAWTTFRASARSGTPWAPTDNRGPRAAATACLAPKRRFHRRPRPVDDLYGGRLQALLAEFGRISDTQPDGQPIEAVVQHAVAMEIHLILRLHGP
jgi:hypothetical protein